MFRNKTLFLIMHITVISVGKTVSPELAALIGQYEKRLGHYIKFRLLLLPDLKNSKNLSENQQKEKEGDLILAQIVPSDRLVLFDEKGKSFSSLSFSNYLQKKMNNSTKKLVFVIGGPYGFSRAVYERSQEKISLSTMTFSHQMVRLFALEQLYRAFTILRNEPYHHR